MTRWGRVRHSAVFARKRTLFWHFPFISEGSSRNARRKVAVDDHFSFALFGVFFLVCGEVCGSPVMVKRRIKEAPREVECCKVCA